MTGGTKGGAHRALTLKAWVRRGGSPVTATPIYHLPSHLKLIVLVSEGQAGDALVSSNSVPVGNRETPRKTIPSFVNGRDFEVDPAWCCRYRDYTTDRTIQASIPGSGNRFSRDFSSFFFFFQRAANVKNAK
jgi:hypothetical protein